MMSSVIPARLVFQCGHAALVSLPRIKGETNAQRAERVAREKSAAQTRACDFCAQRLEVVVQQAAPAPAPARIPPVEAVAPVAPPPVIRRNGVPKVKRVERAAAHVPPEQPAAALVPPVKAATPVPPDETAAALVPPVEAATPVPPDETAAASVPPVEAAAPVPAVEAATPVPPVEAAAPPAGAPPLADWHADRIAKAKPRLAAVAKSVPPPTPKPVGRPRRAAPPVTPSTPNGAVAARPKSSRRVGGVARGGARYTVEFQVQTVVRAADVREALRRVHALGAVEVLAISQES